jgi:PAS domain S-box-containing protein
MALASKSSPDSDRREAALLQWIHEVAPYGVLITDGDLKIQTWNRWLELSSGRSAEEMIGKRLLEVYPDLVDRGVAEKYQRALEGEVCVLSSSFHKYLLPFPTPLREKGGQMLQTARIAPLSLGGRVCGTITLVEDVTQREHQAAELRRQYARQKLLSAASESLLLAPHPARVVCDFAPSLAEHLKADAFAIYLREEETWSLLVHDGKPEKLREWIADISDGFLDACTEQPSCSRIPSVEEAGPDRTRAARVLRERGFFFRRLMVGENLLGAFILVPRKGRQEFSAEDLELIETVSQYIAVALDREHSQKALWQAHQVLETKVFERTARLKDSVQQLESFSYSVAHDLRAPIRAIKGYGEVLLQDFSKELSTKARSYLARIRIAAVKMELLTKDLLGFCQVSQENVVLAPIDLE